MICGKVFIIGAGPGDPGLLTLRGAECLRRADLVLYDYLAGEQILEHAPAAAERVCLGKHGVGRIMTPQEVLARMVQAAQQGQTVVRLKGGDAGIFARLNEEITALERAGVPYEIVPGITAAVAAGSFAGLALTDRDVASCVAFVTGQERTDKEPLAQLDYAALARFPGTLVFYMGVTTAPTWSGELAAHGMRPETPVAIVRRCSLPDQQTVTGTLGQLAELLAPGAMRPPAIVVVGEAARGAQVENWFTRRPLFGRTVLVTRPAHQAQPFAQRLAELGARVLHQPAIEICPPRDWRQVDEAIGGLERFHWIVFSSSNGVEHFMGRLRELGLDLRRLGSAKLAAIGPATAEALAALHLRADVQPADYRAEALAEALAGDARGKRFLLVRASRGRETLAEMLTAAGGDVTQVVVYESRDVAAAQPEVAHALTAGEVDWVTVTSSAIARSVCAMFGDALRSAKLAAISPVTADTLAELGFPPHTVARTYTTEGIVEAILQAEAGEPG